jgi:multicomponent Na+:H+ antiporter subunit A
VAIFKHDLKRVLAYSTVSHLGFITFLIGLGSPLSAVAAVFHILNHATFKAALFMSAGIIDHETGTRQIALLGGLMRHMPLTGVAVALAAFSNAGLPPFFGFIAKEFKYAGLIELGLAGWITTAVMILTNALLLTAAGVVFLRTFLGKEGRYPHAPHEASLPMWTGPMLLAVGGFVVRCLQQPGRGVADRRRGAGGVAHRGTGEPLPVGRLHAGAARQPAHRDARGVLLPAAHPAAAPAVAVAGAVAGERRQGLGPPAQARVRLRHAASPTASSTARCASTSVGWCWRSRSLALIGMVASTADDLVWPEQTSPAEHRRPARLRARGRGRGGRGDDAGAGGAGGDAGRERAGHGDDLPRRTRARRGDHAVDGRDADGDLPRAGVLRKLPPTRLVGSRKPCGAGASMRIVAIVLGSVVSAMMLMTVSQPLPGDIAQWYLDNSLPAGKGANVVNVILVDFRALDTLGEILVVGLAGLAAAGLLAGSARAGGRPGSAGFDPADGARHPARAGSTPDCPEAFDGPASPTSQGSADFASVLLRQAILPLSGLLALVSLVLLWRGHNLPGGGFIGGLVAASATVLLALAFGVARARAVLRVSPVVMLAAGLALAAGAGVIGLVQGEAFLTGNWIFPGGLPLGTPLLFDVGVFLTVLGAVLHMLLRLIGQED